MRSINYTSRNYTKEEVGKICEMYLEGLSYREIANAIDRNVAQVGSVIQNLRDLGADLPKRKGERIKAIREFMKDKV